MSSLRSRRAGVEMRTTLSRKKRSSRKVPWATICSRLRLVAATSRTSSCTGFWLPMRSTARVSRKRSNFTWVDGLTSPISSRKIVPPSAASNRPIRRSVAPVNAPFSWPNSSLSRSVDGSAAQCTARNGARDRGLAWWIACATNSLPVPVSPSISTVARDCATSFTRSMTSLSLAECPTMPSKLNFLSSRSCSCLTSTSRVRDFSARCTMISSFSRLTGLVRKSKAPRFIASTAESMLPYAVIMITTGLFGSVSTLSMTLSPDFPGIRRSVITTSNSWVSSRLKASSALLATETS